MQNQKKYGAATYNKLVRDKIPDIIKQRGEIAIAHTASEKEYEQKLFEKLVEEAAECAATCNESEIADILEVLHAICDLREFSMEQIEKLRIKKVDERGGFKKRIILEETK